MLNTSEKASPPNVLQCDQGPLELVACTGDEVNGGLTILHVSFWLSSKIEYSSMN